jgi:D-sedoheptulose 7-phosphate isomerase
MNKLFANMLAKYPDLDACIADLERAAQLLHDTYARGSKVLICGNGGSAADAEHMVGELMKGYLAPRPIPDELREQLIAAYPDAGEYIAAHLQGALPTFSLVSQTSLITAYANDVAADMIFAQQVYGYGVRGDVLIGISTSGNSKNILQALRVARVRQVRTIGFTGRTGGAMPSLCDVCVRAPFDTTAEIQERHLAMYHALCAALEQEFFSDA